MQAKLPDINSAIVRHRSEALESIKNKNWNLARMALDNINALFPEPYQVEINSYKYFTQTQEHKLIECTNCKKFCVFHDIKIYRLLLNLADSFFTGKKTVDMWNCLECGEQNEYQPRLVKIQKYQEPYYLKCAPEAPKQKRGISGRTTFDSECENWCAIMSREIEHQIGRYRADYQAQQDEEEYTNTEDD